MKTTLLIMAAGIGSRFGTGIKQLEPVDDAGHIIMDYSIHDAIEAGFNHVVFIIRKDIEKEFKEVIGDRIASICASHNVTVDYAFQDINDIPGTLPEGRTKPWGTGQAVLAAKEVIDTPFIVINADDYYGTTCFKIIYDYLSTHSDDDKYRYCMVGYQLKNTVTENGSVARGVCTTDADSNLISVVEHTQIEQHEGGIRFTEDKGETWHEIDGNTIVSMNLWGFSESFIKEAKDRFAAFLDDAMVNNPLKGEYFLPSVVSQLLDEGKASVKVLQSPDKWYGVTYREDKPGIVKALADKAADGLYPTPLWQ